MNRLAKILIRTIGFCICATSYAQDVQSSQHVGQAQVTAEHWLALVDTKQYAESWITAAEPFQQAVRETDWEQTLLAVRTPLGPLKRRILKSATFTKTLPGAPDGEYVVITYNSEFSNKADATETVTPMRTIDGSWKVSGYFIR